MILPLPAFALSAATLFLSACQTPASQESKAQSTGVTAVQTEQPTARALAKVSEPRKWLIKNSQIIELSSIETGRNYEIVVGLPPSFGQHPQREYPVLYVMDGQWDFVLVNKLTGGLRFDQVIDEFLVVGISYGGKNPDYGKLRGEDYTPTRSHPSHANKPFGGDAAKFLQFLENRVFPLVEKRYPVDSSQRMISGSSLGGLFVLYAMLERPEMFHTVLAISPAVHWDERVLFKREERFHASHTVLNTRVWISVGAEDWPHFVAGQKDFSQQLASHHYSGLDMKTLVVQGERHAGVKPEAYNRAVRFAFAPWAAKHPPK